jgi:hypothetical protein
MLRLRFGIPLIIVGIITSGWLSGQDKDKEAPTRLKGKLPPNWKKLGLSDDQVQSVFKVQQKYGGQIDQLTSKIADLRKEEKGALDKILTPAQKDRLREILTGEKTTKDKEPVKDKDKSP